MDNVLKLQDIIGYKFTAYDMISVALSHPGKKKHGKDFSRRFEKLEFLGDRVLGLSLADFVYNNFPNDSEGELALRIASLAGTDFLIKLAKKTKIIDCFSIPKDFFVSLNKNSSSIADMMEAVFGAIFLDSNFETAKKIIVNLCGNDIYRVVHKTKDAKTRLQELAQAKNSELPSYRMIKMTGEPHDPIFEIEVSACGKSSIGYGVSKRNAEHDAAEKMMEILEHQE
ncbi:MAG: ribonuclease III [Holosporaceae bacterium]|jgi:ribonuclease-3|nr:ribonuclease III [Holosporaceae bacterium]